MNRSSHPGLSRNRPPLSPRRRRLRWTLGLLAAFALAGAGWITWYQVQSRPAEYRPGETSPDITRSLAKGLPADAPEPRVVDVTGPAGLDRFRNFAGTRSSQLPEDMGPGLAWGDYDNDGDPDLFLVGAGGGLDLPESDRAACALFENDGNGAFREVADFPRTRILGLGAAWGDADGDGFLDLAVAGYNALRLFHNEGGTGRFTLDERLPEPPGFWSAVAWGDYDNDRRLDLHVAQYVQYAESDGEHAARSEQLGRSVPYTLNPASYPAGRNALFHQQQDGSFRDVAAELGVQNPEGRSLGALWHDFDQDGRLDLYVANDVSDNVFYRNTGSGFEDVSHAAWVADYRSAMGLAAGDFDRDNDDDLFVTHWVAQENALYENLWADANASPPAAVTATNTVPRTWPARFVDIADQQGLGQIALRQVGWGAEFVDLDQDGWLDLLVANGSTIEEEGPAPRRLEPQALFLLWNEHGRCFHNLAPLQKALQEPRVSRGLACADFDGDGDQDFAVADLGDGVRLFRNDMADGGWLKVRLRSRNAAGEANGFGQGSTAIAWVEGVPLRRTVGGVSYLSQSSAVLHWGLGAAAGVDRIEVHWLAGSTNVYEGLQANALYELTEGDERPRRIEGIPTTSAPAMARKQRPAGAQEDRQRVLAFWSKQRAAMDALKVEGDVAKAGRLFEQALELDPGHEDSRYYLALCHADSGRPEAALRELARLQEINPQSQRAWKEWATIRASNARTAQELETAEQAAERAHRINPEETGALMLLGEIALLRGHDSVARDRLINATRTNPKAVGALFLLAHLADARGEPAETQRLLGRVREALGPDWQPAGSTSEGDVLKRHHQEASPLADCWEAWDGAANPATAFKPLQRRLASLEGVRDDY